eukprot:GHVR01143900.1.p1 GENE.GHVR01143900.1~~GHVR01143900.1.p1  ORF type:complete len:220 (+),score=41.53 GHVR01143900.1:262-921(+)
MLAAGFLAVLVSKIAHTFSAYHQRTAERQRQLCDASNFLRRRRVPFELKQRIKRYLEHALMDLHETASHDAFLGHLTQNLRDEVQLHRFGEKLSSLPLFDDASKSQLLEISRISSSVVFAPGDTLCQQGSVGEALFILVYGKLRRESDPPRNVPPLEEGYLGLESLFFCDWVWPWTVRCASFSEIIKVERVKFRVKLHTHRNYIHTEITLTAINIGILI